MKKINSIRDMHTSLKLLGRQKYNAGLWVEPVAGRSTTLGQRLLNTPGIVHLDILDNLLPTLVEGTTRSLGVYDFDDLSSWLEEQSISIAAEKGIVCMEIDAILATFPRTGAQDFFRILDRLVLQKPIVFVTKLKSLVVASQFSDDRIWELDMGEV